jgi:uncharacterized protein YyaL (SSP411 family)
MNELKNAASPYLLQHADNPVDWRMWGPRALSEAKRLDKPILLSIGYAACHWCHVMAHESFEDADTAAVMNDLFVNIKVDREERPDIDHIYMSAVHAFNERGGWPLTMFLTPEGEPFWGGTYFPKTARYGKPAFVDLLRSVAHTYKADPKRVAHNSKVVLDRLARETSAAGAMPTLEALDTIADSLSGYIDKENGGLTGAPKFPNPPVLEFLWRAAGRARQASLYDLVLLSLERMSQGGIYDHLGGGFARYSTDERWLVPHFEKMLYDNAQLLELLALAAEKSGDALYIARATETVDWLTREMTSADGAFCAALDADSEGVEGKFYVWTLKEIEAVLGPEDAGLFGRAYDATPDGNWFDEHNGPRICILNRLETPALPPEDEDRLPALRAKLLARRATRARPGLDDKIMTDWNGLMIAALVNAGTLLERPDWIALAARAYRAIAASMIYTDDHGVVRLAHSRRGGAAVKPGFALDHAAMTRAALALHEARSLLDEAAVEEPPRDYLGDAKRFAEALATYHRDPATGLYCMAASDADDVILRLKPTADDAIPNAHAVAADALVRLAALSGEYRWLEAADTLFEAVAGAIKTNQIGHLGLLNALDTRLRGRTVVAAGPMRDLFTRAALAAPFLIRSVVDLDEAAHLTPGHPAEAQIATAGEGAAFVCADGACSLPIRDIVVLAERLE